MHDSRSRLQRGCYPGATSMEIKQQLRLSQQLVMTPQLQQAIRLLQLSRLELIDEIRKELDANPVLADDEVDPRARPKAPIGTVEADPAAQLAAGDARIERLEMAERTLRARSAMEEKRVAGHRLGAVPREPDPPAAACRRSRGGFDELPPSSRTSPSSVRSSTTCAGSSR